MLYHIMEALPLRPGDRGERGAALRWLWLRWLPFFVVVIVVLIDSSCG